LGRIGFQNRFIKAQYFGVQSTNDSWIHRFRCTLARREPVPGNPKPRGGEHPNREGGSVNNFGRKCVRGQNRTKLSTHTVLTGQKPRVTRVEDAETQAGSRRGSFPAQNRDAETQAGSRRGSFPAQIRHSAQRSSRKQPRKKIGRHSVRPGTVKRVEDAETHTGRQMREFRRAKPDSAFLRPPNLACQNFRGRFVLHETQTLRESRTGHPAHHRAPPQPPRGPGKTRGSHKTWGARDTL